MLCFVLPNQMGNIGVAYRLQVLFVGSGSGELAILIVAFGF
jgi:hypothetical protein